MEVRLITNSDTESYFKLRLVSEKEFPEFVGFNVERELVAGPDKISLLLDAYESEGTLVFGAFESDKLIGVIALSRRLSPKYHHKVFLWGMYVLEEFRGAGVAPALMRAAVSWATQHPKIIAISLQVTLSNIRGQQFYRRLDFNIFGTEKNALFAAGKYHDIHYMELEVEKA